MSEMGILNYSLHDKIGKKSSSSWFSTEKVLMFRKCSVLFYDFIYLRSGPKEKEFCTNSAIDRGKVSEIQHLNKDIIRSLMQLKLHFNKMNFVC